MKLKNTHFGVLREQVISGTFAKNKRVLKMSFSRRKHISKSLHMKVGLLEKGSPTFFMNIPERNSFLNQRQFSIPSVDDAIKILYTILL